MSKASFAPTAPPVDAPMAIDTAGILESPKAAASPSSGSRKQPQHGRTAAPGSTSNTAHKFFSPYKTISSHSIANLSQGNLLDDTASVASSGVLDDAASETQGSRVGTDQRERRPSRQAKFSNFVRRARSTKTEAADFRPPGPTKTKSSEIVLTERVINSRSRERRAPAIPESPQTAPLSPDRGFAEAMQSTSRERNHSVDRATVSTAPTVETPAPKNQGPGRISNFLTSSKKAIGGVGSASKNIVTRFNAQVAPRRPGDVGGDPIEGYHYRILNLNIMDQVKETRLRARLQDAGDKTEFWLPALPYRCIDYLNSRGIEQEGLYRVPGSSRDQKVLQQRFDKERDINLLDIEDFEDTNTIASLLKWWLRELPSPLFPKDKQTKIYHACSGKYHGGTIAPPMLKKELSRLPPYEYYLLFAITAHITLLSKFSHVNKMDYNNLVVCFQPCLNIEPYIFNFLVNDWRNCWQGCWTEKAYLEQELGHPFTVSQTDLQEASDSSRSEDSVRPGPFGPASVDVGNQTTAIVPLKDRKGIPTRQQFESSENKRKGSTTPEGSISATSSETGKARRADNSHSASPTSPSSAEQSMKTGGKQRTKPNGAATQNDNQAPQHMGKGKGRHTNDDGEGIRDDEEVTTTSTSSSLAPELGPFNPLSPIKM